MPAVVMYMPSALPCSTTLVSPPTIATPGGAAASAMARTSASRTSVGRPASRTKVTTSVWALAPETARSFTVPLTASSPMEPPGKRKRPDDETVGGDRDAGSVDVDVGGVAEWSGSGPEKQRREQAFHEPAAGLASGAVGHFDLRIAEANLGS